MTAILADELLERCARAAERSVSATWDPDQYWQTIARAVLTEALQPPPEQDQRQPLDGQEALP